MKTNSLMSKGFTAVKWGVTGIVFLLSVIAQVVGYFEIDTFPDFLWDVLDIVPLFMTLILGFGAGVICLVPTAASMLVWIIQDGMWNMGFSILVFFTAIILLSLLRKYILRSNLGNEMKTTILTIGFEVSLIYSRTFYHGLRTIFSPIIKGKYIQYLRWEKAMNLFATWSNVIFAVLLIALLFVMLRSTKEGNEG